MESFCFSHQRGYFFFYKDLRHQLSFSINQLLINQVQLHLNTRVSYVGINIISYSSNNVIRKFNILWVLYFFYTSIIGLLVRNKNKLIYKLESTKHFFIYFDLIWTWDITDFNNLIKLLPALVIGIHLYYIGTQVAQGRNEGSVFLYVSNISGGFKIHRVEASNSLAMPFPEPLYLYFI